MTTIVNLIWKDNLSQNYQLLAVMPIFTRVIKQKRLLYIDMLKNEKPRTKRISKLCHNSITSP